MAREFLQQQAVEGRQPFAQAEAGERLPLNGRAMNSCAREASGRLPLEPPAQFPLPGPQVVVHERDMMQLAGGGIVNGSSRGQAWQPQGPIFQNLEGRLVAVEGVRRQRRDPEVDVPGLLLKKRDEIRVLLVLVSQR